MNLDDFQTLSDPAESPRRKARVILPPLDEDQIMDLENE